MYKDLVSLGDMRYMYDTTVRNMRRQALTIFPDNCIIDACVKYDNYLYAHRHRARIWAWVYDAFLFATEYDLYAGDLHVGYYGYQRDSSLKLPNHILWLK